MLKCLKELPNKKSRQFYIRVLAALYKERDIETIEKHILSLTTVALSKTVGLDNDGQPVTSDLCFKELDGLVQGVSVEEQPDDQLEVEDDEDITGW